MKKINKKNLLLGISFIFLSLFFFFIYYQRITELSFFDEYANMVAGYFMQKGRALYSENFINHQMLMPYISYLLQTAFQPDTLYKLIAIHRVFIFTFAAGMNLLLVYRFRYTGLLFMLFFEATKYYLSGSLFLPESFIVYPMVYLLGLVWNKYSKRSLSLFDYIISAIFVWAVVFSREPYIPPALLLYVFLLINSPGRKILLSVLIFVTLSLITILSTSLTEYFNQVLFVNFSTIMSSEAKTTNLFGIGLLKVFFYPIVILLEGYLSYFRVILIAFSVTFLILLSFFFREYKNYKLVFIGFLVLGVANLRFVNPGEMFFGSFHMLPWFALFLFIICLLCKDVLLKIDRKGIYFLGFLFSTLLCVVFLLPQSFIHYKLNRDEQFTINYGRFYSHGAVIQALAEKGDTLFIDMSDSLIYWQAGLESPYKYSVFYPVMTDFPVYRDEREKMFLANPPIFYYVSCEEKFPEFAFLPDMIKNDYRRVYYDQAQTCLFIRRTRAEQIGKEKLEKIGKFGFTL